MRFNVTLTETVVYIKSVDADTAEEAEENVKELWVQCGALDQELHFFIHGDGVESQSEPCENRIPLR